MPKTFCKHGHEFTPENTYTRPNGRRECRTCQKQRDQQNHEHRKLSGALAAYDKIRQPIRRANGINCWRCMIQRCYYPKHDSYHCYGGAAVPVSVCDRWRFGENGKSGFECFIEDMGPRPSLKHSISRYGDVGNYEPGNCEWSDQNFGPNGERNGQAKLTTEQVLAIRASSLSHRELAKLYDVHSTTIGEVKRNEIWQHISIK